MVQQARLMVVGDARVFHQTWRPAWCQYSSQCHPSAPWPFQSWPLRLPPVDPTFAETYHEAPCSSCSPSQPRRVVLSLLAAIETHKNMILKTTRKWWWSQIRQANLKVLPVLSKQQVVIGNRCSQNSQSLDIAITRESQTHDVDICGAGKA